MPLAEVLKPQVRKEEEEEDEDDDKGWRKMNEEEGGRGRKKGKPGKGAAGAGAGAGEERRREQELLQAVVMQEEVEGERTSLTGLCRQDCKVEVLELAHSNLSTRGWELAADLFVFHRSISLLSSCILVFLFSSYLLFCCHVLLFVCSHSIPAPSSLLRLCLSLRSSQR